MMRITLLMLLLVGLVAPAPAKEPVYVFQRVNVLVAHYDNSFTLRVWPDGQAEMRFPSYAAQAGHYQWQLEPQAQAALETQFSQLAELELDGTSIRMTRQPGQTLTEVTDADWLRLEYRPDGRAAVEVMLESPDAWHRALPDIPELARLAKIQAEIFDWMQRSARELGQ